MWSTMQEERLDDLDYHFSETKEDIQLCASKRCRFSETTFYRLLHLSL